MTVKTVTDKTVTDKTSTDKTVNDKIVTDKISTDKTATDRRKQVTSLKVAVKTDSNRSLKSCNMNLVSNL